MGSVGGIRTAAALNPTATLTGKALPFAGNFGSFVLPQVTTVGPLTTLFSFFERAYEPGFILLSKIFGNVLPRTAITRNNSERKEVLFNELTQGSTLFVMLPLGSAVANPLQQWFSGISARQISGQNAVVLSGLKGIERQRVLIAKLGKSLGVSALIASMLVATTYLRNYRTIRRTGFSDYKQVVGLGGSQAPTAEDRNQADEAARKNLKIIQGLLLGGLAAMVGIMGVAGWIARRGNLMLKPSGFLNPERLERWFKDWAFVGKHSNQINAVQKSAKQSLWVWGVPSYLGWFLGCRDQYEVIEQASKFGTFLLGYITTPRLVRALMERVDAKVLDKATRFKPLNYGKVLETVSKEAPELTQPLLRHLNTRNALALAVNLVVVGAMPVVFNQFFTAWRYRREQAEQAETEKMDTEKIWRLQAQSEESVVVRRKSFQQWGQS